MNDRLRITVRVEYQDETGKFVDERRALEVDKYNAEWLRRLPKAREFLFDEAMEAEMQRAERHRQTQHLGRKLGAGIAEIVLDAIESRDTINGYDPEEYAAPAAPQR